MVTHIRRYIRTNGRTQQGQTDLIFQKAYAVLPVVQDGDAAVRLAEIAPLVVAALKASLLPSSIAVGVPGNITGGSIAQRLPCQHIAVKQHFGQHMLLLPVHLIFHLNGAVSAEQPQVLGPGGLICLQHGLKSDAFAVLLDQSQRLRHGQGHLLVSVIRQNVPGVIVAGFILIKSQFIKGTVCPLSLHFLVIQACYGAVHMELHDVERRLHTIAVHLQPVAAIGGLAQDAAAQGCQIGQQPVASLAHTVPRLFSTNVRAS